MSAQSRKTKHIAFYVVMVLLCVVFLVPMYMALITSFKARETINLTTAWKLPHPFEIVGYQHAITKLAPYLKNSVILTVSGTVISSMLGAINGYIFSKNKFKGSELIFTLLLFGMFIPYQIILIPLFETLTKIHMTGLGGLILAHVIYGIPIVTMLFRNFYDQIPDSILESGRIDGASYFTVFSKLILPLSIPSFVVVGIWQFTQIWNEFLWAICLTSQETNPITVGLSQLAGGQAVAWNDSMAGAIISAIPVLCIYIFLGKYFVQGLLAGSVKE
ncbi:MAG: carbohydrate ABC transporter permease [Spirochaetia bacterium]|jgi:glucose/mannose transport system permease protein|nr:carbohydrate ABC transporter permease [Spirochaetia bacterium]